MARAIGKDGVEIPVVRSIASCGTDGKHTRNEERDLWRWLWNIFPVVAPYMLHVNLETGDEPGVTEPALLPVLIPFEMAHGMHQHGPMQWTSQQAR
jgi:hypothetical protein